MDADEIDGGRRPQALAAGGDGRRSRRLLDRIRRLPPDSKVERLKDGARRACARDGYPQVMIFTQYTDTMDFLRERPGRRLRRRRMMCFSGRGGEVMAADGDVAHGISRETIKRRFREGRAEYLLCTDAAAEGLNFQFCGALVNYDMPWNPMRVEQRIGRIDRLGQQHRDDPHRQPALQRHGGGRRLRGAAPAHRPVRDLRRQAAADPARRCPARITEAALAGGERELARSAARQRDRGGGDARRRPRASTSTPSLPPIWRSRSGRRRFTIWRSWIGCCARPDLLPPGVEAKPLHGSPRQFSYTAPGLGTPVRVTTDPDVFDEHPESVELWSPGSPLFPEPEDVASAEEVAAARGRLSQVFQRLRG